MTECVVCGAFLASGALWFMVGSMTGDRRATRRFTEYLASKEADRLLVEKIVARRG